MFANQAKTQRIQNPIQRNADDLNTVGREIRKHFRNKQMPYLKAKIEEVEPNGKINIRDLYRFISDFKN
jgi:hypothetical protein